MLEKLNTQRRFILLDKHMETPKGISCTVPAETMTIREILTKFSRGQRIDATMRRDGKFEENSDFDSEDLEAAGRLDLTDRDEVADRMREKNEAGKADLQRLREESIARKKASQEANKLKKQESENKKSDSEKPPGSSSFAARERGATGGQAEGELSRESNEE